MVRSWSKLDPRHVLLSSLFVAATLTSVGCGIELPERKPVVFEPFDLSEIAPLALPPRPSGQRIGADAIEFVTDLGVPDGQPGHDSQVRVVLPSKMPSGKVPALVVNGSGAYLFSGMILSDEDIEPMLPYVNQGFAVIAYETDGCQPSFERDPTPSDIAEMTRNYVASKAGLVNAERALSFALKRFPEIDANQLYAIGHSSGGKQALLLSSHDKRIRGCVAFAPACQMDMGSKMSVARIGGVDGDVLSREVERSMPIVHADKTTAPMLLVYSKSDRITRPSEVLTYAKAIGKGAVAVPVKCDGHGSVPDAGYKLALAWLRTQVKRNAGSNNQVTLVSQSGGSSQTHDVSSAGSGETQDAVASSPAEGATTSAADSPTDNTPTDTPVAANVSVVAPAPVAPPKPAMPVQTRPAPRSTHNPAGVQANPFFTD